MEAIRVTTKHLKTDNARNGSSCLQFQSLGGGGRRIAASTKPVLSV